MQNKYRIWCDSPKINDGALYYGVEMRDAIMNFSKFHLQACIPPYIGVSPFSKDFVRFVVNGVDCSDDKIPENEYRFSVDIDHFGVNRKVKIFDENYFTCDLENPKDGFFVWCESPMIKPVKVEGQYPGSVANKFALKNLVDFGLKGRVNVFEVFVMDRLYTMVFDVFLNSNKVAATTRFKMTA